MHKKTLFASLVLSLLVVDDVLSQRDGGRRRGRGRRSEARDVKLEHFDYKPIEFDTESLEAGTAECAIYLPKGFDDEANEERTYPWAVWLHGMNENYRRFHSEGGAEVLDKLRGENKIPEMILVAANATRRTIYANGEPAGDIEKLIVEDLTAHLETNYRASKKRRERAIMGVSIGGMGALKIAFKHSGVYGTVAAHSSAMFPPDPRKLGAQARRVEFMIQRLGWSELIGDPIDPEKWADFVPSAVAAKMKPKDFQGLRIYFDACTGDRYGFAPPNEDFDKQLDDLGVAHTFTLVDGGGHSWGSGSLQKQLIASLQYVGAGFTADDAKKPDDDDDKVEAADKNNDK